MGKSIIDTWKFRTLEYVYNCPQMTTLGTIVRFNNVAYIFTYVLVKKSSCIDTGKEALR